MSLSTDPERMGAEMRRQLTGTENEAFGADWRNAFQAFEAWRELLERSGVLVFLFPLGKDSCQGFSLWHEDAPLIAVNTAWNSQARIFTVFHEYGHLLTRTSSACLERSEQRTSQEEDEGERNCERFAASLLISSAALKKFLRERYDWRPNEQIADLNEVRALASRFKVSLRAATIRLIELGIADWSLYRAIPPISDAKPKGGGGGGRDRGEIREDQYGPRTVSVFVRALDRNILSRFDVLEYLDVSDSHLDRLHPGPAG
jgi:Zn-dependent peptidase ImmA (M78 family)